MYSDVSEPLFLSPQVENKPYDEDTARVFILELGVVTNGTIQ
jgi:hypothetical protein